MDISDQLLVFERHLVGELCWDCHAATAPASARQRRCPACGRRWSYAAEQLRWHLLRAFCLNATAFQAARTLGCTYATAHGVYQDARLAVLRLANAERRTALAQAGLRLRQSRTLTPLVLIVELDARVFVLFPRLTVSANLMSRLAAFGIPTAVYDTTTAPTPAGFRRVSPPPASSSPRRAGRPLLGGVDAFWAALLRQSHMLGSVRPANLPARLNEHEYRYNHRAESLLDTLGPWFLSRVRDRHARC